jgi:NADH-quinone oxidoreductase subunit A
VAIFFIVFDVEAAFIFTWAVVWDLLGIMGVIQITVFIVILAAGLVWLWLKGGLEWGPSRGSRFMVSGSGFKVQGSRFGEPDAHPTEGGENA